MSSTAVDLRTFDRAAWEREEAERAAFFAAMEEGFGDDESRAGLDTRLDFLLQKMADRDLAIANNDEVADRRIAMIEGWRRQQNATIEREIGWLRLHFEALADGYDFGNARSRSLPHGSFGFRKGPDRVEVVDMAKAVQWAKENGLEAELKVSIDKTPLRKAWAPNLKATGEAPDPTAAGFDYILGEDSFFVKPVGAK